MILSTIRTSSRPGRLLGFLLVLTLFGAAAECAGAEAPAASGPASAAAALAPVTVAPEKLLPAYDVVVAGAGTGGTMAAVQAARLGAQVLLVEEADWVGGQMTAAAVSSMDEAGPRVRQRGLYREFTDRISKHYDRLGLSTDTCYVTPDHFGMEPRVAQKVLLDLLQEARSPEGKGGVHLLLLSRVTSVSKEGNRVTGVELLCGLENTVQRKRKIGSRILIDATELGDVLPLTGARYRLGNRIAGGDASTDTLATDAHIQHFTWTAVIKAWPEGAPPELILKTPPPDYDRSYFAAALNSPRPQKSTNPWSWQRFIAYRGMPDSANPDPSIRNPWAEVTRTHMNIGANDVEVTAEDLLDPVRWRKKEYELKVQTLGLLYYIQNDMDAPMTTWTVATDEGYDTPYNRFQNARLVREHPELARFLPVLKHFPVMPYARESRRLVGLKTMRAREIDRRSGPLPNSHSVAVGDYPVDLHGSDNPADIELDLDCPEDISAIGFTPDHMGPFPIPFEAFIPETVDGLLAAEKNISQSRLVNGATRLQPSTMLTGQAAGAIAGLAVRHSIQPRELRPAAVQQVLLEAGDVLVARRDGLEIFAGVEPYTPLWQDVQLALLYGGLDPEDAGGWRGDWRFLSGAAGKEGWDADEGRGLTFRGKSSLAVIRRELGEDLPAEHLADGILRARVRPIAGGQAGLVGRLNGPKEFYLARQMGGSVEILRWSGTTVTTLAKSPAKIKGHDWVQVELEMKGTTLTARLLSDDDRLLATCTANDSLYSAGEAGLRIQATQPMEVAGFEVLSVKRKPLFTTTFPAAEEITRAPMTPEMLTRLRKRLAGSDASRLIPSSASGTVADWARKFAAHLRQQPAVQGDSAGAAGI